MSSICISRLRIRSTDLGVNVLSEIVEYRHKLSLVQLVVAVSVVPVEERLQYTLQMLTRLVRKVRIILSPPRPHTPGIYVSATETWLRFEYTSFYRHSIYSFTCSQEPPCGRDLQASPYRNRF